MQLGEKNLNKNFNAQTVWSRKRKNAEDANTNALVV